MDGTPVCEEEPGTGKIGGNKRSESQRKGGWKPGACTHAHASATHPHGNIRQMCYKKAYSHRVSLVGRNRSIHVFVYFNASVMVHMGVEPCRYAALDA